MFFLTLIQIAAITCTSVHGLPVEKAYDNNKLHSLVDYLRDNNAYLSFEKRDADFGAHRNVNYNEQKLDDFLFPEEDEEMFSMPKMDLSSKQEKVMPEAKNLPGVLSRLQEMVPNPLSWFNATSISENVQSYKKPVYEYAKNAFKKFWGPVDKEVLRSQQMVEDERAQAELKRTLQDILAGKKMRTDIRNHLMTLARKVYTSNSFDLSADPQDERAMHYKLEREVVEKLSDLAIAQLNADFSGTPTTGRSG
ncbi:hypothetical protein OY671_000379 [Metschnikowia pulcherrima]|nr:hypothetical protein OY671_000379 [Metschnikowia pulcherrima]